MDENATLIRMNYQASDVRIVAQHNHADLWQLQHSYRYHHLWLQQVYRTLIENDQHTAILHIINIDVGASTWQSACEGALAARTNTPSYILAHVICRHTHGDLDSSTEQWIRHSAKHYAVSGQRINGVTTLTNNMYIKYLLQHDSSFLSGAVFGNEGEMLRSGCLASERILAHYWVEQHACTTTVPVS